MIKHISWVALALIMAGIAAPSLARAGVASEAVEQVARQMTKALGREAVEFGGERATRELATRLIREGGEESIERLSRIARAGEPATIRALQNVSGRSLRYLDDVPDEQLVRAVGTLARPGVSKALASLGSEAARSAALRAEMQLPGAGASLVRDLGAADGLTAAARLTDTQANQLLKPQRVEVVRGLSAPQKRALVDALASDPAAQVQVVRTAGRSAVGSIAVVAGGAVLWHATDVALAPVETIVTHPDGTVERTTRSVGAQAAAAMPETAGKLAPAAAGTGVALAGALAVIGCTAVFLRHRRRLSLGHARNRVRQRDREIYLGR